MVCLNKEMKNILEIWFWRIAIRIIKKGYGEDCPDEMEGCPSCEARKVIEWIEDHILLIEEFK